MNPCRATRRATRKYVFSTSRLLSTAKKGFDGSIDYFGYEGQADLYATYRPRYTTAVIDALIEKTKVKTFAVDVACGPGLLTNVRSNKAMEN